MTSEHPEPNAPVDTRGMAAQPRRTDPDFDLLSRHASRALDPTTAVRFRDQQVHPTVYGGSRLLVRPTVDEDEVLERLREIAGEFDLDVEVNAGDERLRQLAREAGIGPEDPQPLLRRIELIPRSDEPLVHLPDAWPVLQRFRASYPANAPQRTAVQLDHVLTSHSDSIVGTPYWKIPGTVGNPYWKIPSGNPYLDVPSGVAEYARPGFGGRAPVAWVGPEPATRPEYPPEGQRWPVIAVLDTGIAEHRWFPEGIVIRDVRCADLPIGLPAATGGAEQQADQRIPLDGQLGPIEGHGTFIAGLIRQKCPTATILSVQVIQDDGVVAEADLLDALNKLWLRQKLAIATPRPEDLIDVVSMSLGYYHEDYADLEFDPLLLAPIRALAQLGVAIIVSSGNDATTRPMYPAAFAPYPDGIIVDVLRDELPVVAVGASNPDRSVALFSNEGAWVSAHRPGAALVSTFPPTDAAGSPSVEFETEIVDPALRQPHGKTIRSTLDPDDFTAGFAVWSGSSFAAPIVAGEVAAHLFAMRLPPADDVDPQHAVNRGWDAISARVPTLQRPGQESEYATGDAGSSAGSPQ
jgi:subtilisin family serine protease